MEHQLLKEIVAILPTLNKPRTPTRFDGPGKGTGYRQQTAGRLRSIALTESPFLCFGA